MIRRFLKYFLLIFLIFILIILGYFFLGSAPQTEKINWGMNFSQKHTENLGLDWKETYLAFLDDLGSENIKLIVHWDLFEPTEGEYNFKDLDWQISEIEKREGRLLLVVGIKTPRWPECHIPDWAKSLNKEEQQERIIKLIETIVLRYKNSNSLWAWQVENEPFFAFGECLWIDEEFLKKEIDLVKTLDDKKRPVIISDSGEGSFWFNAAKVGDIIGTTLHRKVWFKEFNFYVHYPFKPVFYWRKAQIVDYFYGKEVICGELQVEPWCPKLLYDCSLEEQAKTMNLEQFKKNIQFAKETGLKEFYLWGGEWIYWMKEKQNKPEIWEEAKKLFLNK